MKMDLELQSRNQSLSILDLPEEIRGIIFNKLKQTEALPLRLVCQQWDEEIRTYYNFHIIFDEQSSNCNLVRQLSRITSLDISQLYHPLQLEQGTGMRVLGQTIKHLHLIKKLIIKSTAQILPQRVVEMIWDFATSIKSLSIGLSADLMSHQCPSNVLYDFQNLEHVHMFVDVAEEFMDTLVPADNQIVCQFEKSKFPQLKFLDIEGYSKGLTWAVGTLVKLMNKNPKGLKRVSILWEYGCRLEPIELDEEDLMTLKTVKNLEVIEFNFKVVVPPFQLKKVIKILSELVLNQSNLRRVVLGHSFPVNESFLRLLVCKSFESLGVIRLHALRPEDGNMPFDLSLFRDCVNLHTLLLERTEVSPSREMISYTPELINLTELPCNISKLSFINFNVQSRDLSDFLDSSNSLFGLKTLELRNCGDIGDLGIDLRVLRQLRNLKENKLAPLISSIIVLGFNLSGSGDATFFDLLKESVIEIRNDSSLEIGKDDIRSRTFHIKL